MRTLMLICGASGMAIFVATLLYRVAEGYFYPRAYHVPNCVMALVHLVAILLMAASLLFGVLGQMMNP